MPSCENQPYDTALEVRYDLVANDLDVSSPVPFL